MEKISKCFRIALIQMSTGMNKADNINRALSHIRKAVTQHSPKIVALPECFNTPYGTKYFREYAESIPTGSTCTQLSAIAKELGVYLIGGSIPEHDESEDKIYNTCTIWSPNGSLIACHRKMHLFDIDVKGGQRFKESDVLSPGRDFTVVEVDGAKIGIGICYDLRFDEMARVYRNMGCDMLVYPAAFNMTTGPLHWEVLQRGRANDLQLYVATISAARNVNFEYVAYGHSMVVDPWGKVICSAKDAEEIICAEIDLDIVQGVRAQIPTSNQRRTELYETVKKL